LESGKKSKDLKSLSLGKKRTWEEYKTGNLCVKSMKEEDSCGGGSLFIPIPGGGGGGRMGDDDASERVVLVVVDEDQREQPSLASITWKRDHKG